MASLKSKNFKKFVVTQYGIKELSIMKTTFLIDALSANRLCNCYECRRNFDTSDHRIAALCFLLRGY